MKRYERRIEEKNYVVSVVRALTDIAVVVAIAIFLFVYFGDNVKIAGTSMEPTFSDEAVLLLDKFTYAYKDAERYDVVAFNIEGSDTVYIKRIIGLPGENVQIRYGKIYINGKELKDDVVKDAEKIINAGVYEKEIKLGEDEYFVLGDNRNSSEDSRFTTIGNVKKENIIGKAWLEVTSLDDFGLVNNKE
ncbi:MAG: signal peptidase I [Lachnospiraceae bacterium]|nr:signal peptidase I [Lachnospiraceae bacterium]